jgi:hypothetical protein
MTAFNFVFLENFVAIAMDSLALDGENGEPLGFWTKVFPLPHLRGVMCATGIMQIGLDWFIEIESHVLCNSVTFLDSIAPARLRAIAERYPTSRTTTVYHFGYDPDLERLRGFAYRGTSDFASEELQAGYGIKPPTDQLVQLFPRAVAERGLVPAFVEVITQQKIDDEAKPPLERVGIGGEVHVLTLIPDEQFVWNCHRFDDYASSYQRMLERLRQQNQQQQTVPPADER